MRNIMVLRAVLAASVVLAAATGSAHAASISIASLGGDAEQALVLVQGDLVPEDIDDFRDKTGSLRKAVIAFDSAGGSLVAGIEIGKMIRLKNFATLVAQGERCASACAVAWLGGTQRLMGPQARIGFHAAYTVQLGQAAETGVGNAVLGAYLNQIGVPTRAIVYITETPPNSMTWLTLADAEQHGIDVTSFNPAQSSVGRDKKKSAPVDSVTQLQRRTGKFLSGLLAKWSGPKTWQCQLLKTCPRPKARVGADGKTAAPMPPPKPQQARTAQEGAPPAAETPQRASMTESSVYGGNESGGWSQGYRFPRLP